MNSRTKAIGLSQHKTLRHTADAKRQGYTVCGRYYLMGNMRLTNHFNPEATCTTCKEGVR